MAQSSSVKIGWVVMFIMGIYLAVLGLMSVFAYETTMTTSFRIYVGQDWSDFVANSPKPAEMMTMISRLTGANLIGIGIFIVMMAWNAYRKAQRWSWYTALFAGILGWGSGLAYQITIASPSGVVVTIIGSALFLIALLVPARAILGAKAGGK